MADFSHLAKSQKVSGDDTAVYEFYDIANLPEASLVVSPATRSNKPYNNAVLTLMLPKQRRLAGGKISADFLEQYREDLIPIYAKHILRNWANIEDRDGQPVPFNAENAEGFLRALGNQQFDALIGFCEDESNFRSVEAEDAAKN